MSLLCTCNRGRFFSRRGPFINVLPYCRRGPFSRKVFDPLQDLSISFSKIKAGGRLALSLFIFLHNANLPDPGGGGGGGEETVSVL